MNKAFCIWLTGLRASGKTTLALLLENELRARGLKVEVVDTEVLAPVLAKGNEKAGLADEADPDAAAYIAKILVRNGIAAIVASTSPEQAQRDRARSDISGFIEVFVNCPLQTCIQRDQKGIYKAAQSGELENLAGFNAPYEAPSGPDVEVRTGEESPEVSLVRIIQTLDIFRYIPDIKSNGYSEEENRLIEKRLTELGYL